MLPYYRIGTALIKLVITVPYRRLKWEDGQKLCHRLARPPKRVVMCNLVSVFTTGEKMS